MRGKNKGITLEPEFIRKQEVPVPYGIAQYGILDPDPQESETLHKPNPDLDKGSGPDPQQIQISFLMVAHSICLLDPDIVSEYGSQSRG